MYASILFRHPDSKNLFSTPSLANIYFLGRAVNEPSRSQAARSSGRIGSVLELHERARANYFDSFCKQAEHELCKARLELARELVCVCARACVCVMNALTLF